MKPYLQTLDALLTHERLDARLTLWWLALMLVGPLVHCSRADAQTPSDLTPWLQEQSWVRDRNEPVLRLGESGDFDDMHLFAPCVVADAGQFKLWYCGSRGKVEHRVFALGLATSRDGRRFEKFGGNPVFQFGDTKHSVLTPSVVREGNHWRVWFAATDFTDGTGLHTLHTSRSDDGVHWSASSPPLLSNVYAPTVVKTDDGYRMWFTRVGQNPWVIAHASSPDGLRWTVSPEPVLNLDQPWESSRLFYPTVVHHDGIFLMWYGSYWQTARPDQKTALGFAVSRDGLQWHKHPGNPVFRPEPANDWESHYVTSQSIMRQTDRSWRLWYASRTKPPFHHKYFAIGTATWAGPDKSRPAPSPATRPAAERVGFSPVPEFDEVARWSRLGAGERVYVNAPSRPPASRTRLVIYATPNGSTIEQTLGSSANGLDWRFDIQHVAAQIRRLRELGRGQDEDLVLVVVQAPSLSWPAYCRDESSGRRIRELVAALVAELRVDRVSLAGHSGGGSFVLGYVTAGGEIPSVVDRIVLLDANYSYSEEAQHGDRLLAWLTGDLSRKLVVLAYDDREIMLNGKRVVGSDGGTYRASERMMTWFRRELALSEESTGQFRRVASENGQIEILVHSNLETKILHTALVGEMNGLLYGLTTGSALVAESKLGGPRAYTRWIPDQPFVDPTPPRAVIAPGVADVRLAIPPRALDAPSGSQFRKLVEALPRDQREAAIVREIVAGNVPVSLRRLVPLKVTAVDQTGRTHTATYLVTHDYLAIGSDSDSFRIPTSLPCALRIADALQGSLITPKISDDIFSAAQVRLDPRPLTRDRESVATFYQHHQIVEAQLAGRSRGLLTCGIKKDIVLTNRLQEKPHRVAIYGWHHVSGEAIQRLYVGHVDWYADYSHGLRLVSNEVVVDGEKRALSEVLTNSRLCGLFSDEGPINIAALRAAVLPGTSGAASPPANRDDKGGKGE